MEQGQLEFSIRKGILDLSLRKRVHLPCTTEVRRVGEVPERRNPLLLDAAPKVTMHDTREHQQQESVGVLGQHDYSDRGQCLI